MKKLLGYLTLSLLATAGLTHAATNLMMQPLATFGTNGDGTLRPNDLPFLTVDGINNPPHQRGLAYNHTTGHLLVVNKQVPEIRIIDALTGADTGTILTNNAMAAGGNANFYLNMVGVADDGAIYACNMSSSQFPPELRVYRWANETAEQTLVFPVIGSGNFGDPSNGTGTDSSKRWGDTLAVRGSGVNTEILLASRGTLVALLRPVDGSMTGFTSTPLNCPVPVGGLGFGLTFGAGNTFYGKNAGEVLYHLGYDLNTSTVTNVVPADVSRFSVNVAPMGVNSNATLLAGIAVVGGADRLHLYDISDPINPPVLLDRKSYATTASSGSVGAIAYSSNVVYALDADNGIMAMELVPGTAQLPPIIHGQPQNRIVTATSNAVFTLGVDGSLPITYQWYFNSTNLLTDQTNVSLTISNVQSSNAGGYSAIAQNSYGAVTSSVATLTVSAATGASLFYDPFDYAAASSLSGQGGWITNGFGNQVGTIEAGNLDVTGLASSVGNKVSLNNTTTSLRRPLGSTFSTGTVYYSYAMRVDTLGAGFTGTGTLAGFTSGTGTAFGTKTDIKNDGAGGYNLGVSKPGGATQIFAPTSFAVGQTVFIVGRYIYNGATADDVSDMWLNPDSTTFGSETAPTPTLTTTGGTDVANIDRFFLRVGSGSTSPSKVVIDEIRTGRTWAEVTPVYVAPATPPTLQAAVVDGDFVVTWPSSYTGFTLEGTTSLTPPVTWSSVSYSTSGTNNVATLNKSSGNRFLRLKK